MAGSITIDEGVAPSTPATGDVIIYAKTDGLLYYKDDTGQEVTLSGSRLGTSAAASGTSVDFTGIPSWVKRIVISLSGISTNGTNNLLVTLGDAGGFETTGYLGSAWSTSAGVGTLDTTSFIVTSGVAAATVMHGQISLSLLDSSTNTWTSSGILAYSNAASVQVSGGSKSLSATLDRVRITTSGGVNTFDGGNFNIVFS